MYEPASPNPIMPILGAWLFQLIKCAITKSNQLCTQAMEVDAKFACLQTFARFLLFGKTFTGESCNLTCCFPFHNDDAIGTTHVDIAWTNRRARANNWHV